jgi:multidrug efflux system outer membrane protein
LSRHRLSVFPVCLYNFSFVETFADHSEGPIELYCGMVFSVRCPTLLCEKMKVQMIAPLVFALPLLFRLLVLRLVAFTSLAFTLKVSSHRFVPMCVLLVCSGCTSIKPASLPEFEYPPHWSSESSVEHDSKPNQLSLDSWLEHYLEPNSQAYLEQVLSRNYQLAVAWQQVLNARAQQRVVRASRWPSLGATLAAQRNETKINGIENSSRSAELNATVAWEVDLWGKLSAQSAAARANLLANEAEFKGFQLSLAAEAFKAWFDALEAAHLTAMFEQRLSNLKENQDIIESGFRQGLNDALDVYLVRSDVAQEEARVLAQRQLQGNAIRTLQLFMGQYPSGEWERLPSLPDLPGILPAGIPADILQRRYDLQVAQFRLHEANAEVAAAHRARFPTLGLTAVGGISSKSLSDLLSDNSSSWSVLGNLTQPLFDYGSLKSKQQIAEYTLVQLEQNYIDSVYQAFSEVESLIANEAALRMQYDAYLLARQNALAAEQQSFEQYRNGLITYTTVLESQRRAFDAQSNVIQLKNQLLQNRISLHLALGGDIDNALAASE